MLTGFEKKIKILLFNQSQMVHFLVPVLLD